VIEATSRLVWESEATQWLVMGYPASTWRGLDGLGVNGSTAVTCKSEQIDGQLTAESLLIH
jgi:hypothetical protein